MADISHDRPGVLHRLRDHATSARLAVTIDVPPSFNAMFPFDWDGTDEGDGYDGWARRADEAVQELASEFVHLPIAEIADRIVTADAEAVNAGIEYPRLTPRLSQLLARRLERPDGLLDALEQRGAASDILLPILERITELRLDGWEATLERFLMGNTHLWIAIQIALTSPVGSRIKDIAIQRMIPPYARMVDILVARGQVDADTTERLLNAPDQMVARSTAVAVAIRSDRSPHSDLPETLRQRWREVIAQSPADDSWYSVILGRDPELFGDWLAAWFTRLQQEVTGYEHIPHSLEAAIGRLPVNLRIRLIREVPQDVPSFYVQDVVTQLVSSDMETAAALFERAELEDLHWTALRTGPSEPWMELALIALDRGWAPARIVAPTVFGEAGWIGEESLHWQTKIDAFIRLRRNTDTRDPRRELITSAGIEYYERRRDEAAKQERQDRTFGR